MGKPQQRIKVTYADGREVEAPVGPKAQVMMERRYQVPLSKLAEEEASVTLESVYYLAWVALRASKLEDADDFDAFLELIEDVEVVEPPKGATVPPTGRAGRRRATSSS